MTGGWGKGTIDRALMELQRRAREEGVNRAAGRQTALEAARRRQRRAEARAEGQWFIIRTGGPQTIRLATSLATAGLGAWTPKKTVRFRRPRSKETYERTIPILPTFVFVPGQHLIDVAQLADRPSRGDHPAFSLMRFADGVPHILSREIERFRRMEREAAEDAARQAAKRDGRSLPIGMEVTMTTHGFDGMSATVVESNGKTTRLDLGGWLGTVQIETFILLPDSVSGSSVLRAADA